MSAKKRRIKRKIAQLCRMDAQFYYNMWDDRRCERFKSNMRALSLKLGDMGYKWRTIRAMNDARTLRGQRHL